MSHEIDSFELLIHHSLPWTVVGKLDQISSHVVTFWVLSSAFWIKVFGDEHHWLLSPCCYTTSMWTVPTCKRQNLGAIPSRLDARKHPDYLFHLAGKASPLLSDIESRSRNKRRNLWVGWCVSSWRPWFWPRVIIWSQPAYAEKVTRTWHTWNKNEDCCNYQQPLVDSEQQYSKYRYRTHPLSNFLDGWLIFMQLELF